MILGFSGGPSRIIHQTPVVGTERAASHALAVLKTGWVIGPRAQTSGELLSATVAESDTRRSLRAAAAVMRSTADRFDAVLSVESLSESEALDRLALEAEELCRAMETLDRELEELG